MGRLIGGRHHAPVYLDTRAPSDPLGEELAELWRTERLEERWRNRYVLHCRIGARQRYPLPLLDDGTVLPNSYDGDEASRTYAQVVGFADPMYAAIAGFRYSNDAGGSDSVVLWRHGVESPGCIIGRHPIYRSREGHMFIAREVVEHLREMN
ncbi:hypothetical protein [Mycobacteroides abscessus]|uniref:hypothetical protein n=1 Tax=Mycobacteroides abscessus TaxID=36809 RepID=UPI00104386C5|nr:hypothetical protein [Mycobacteroides abscessus]MBN7488263.1 hypothetical protein [Mycobacteroides abscessus subsp. abscessus]